MQKRRLIFLLLAAVFIAIFPTTLPAFSASGYIIGLNNDVIALSNESPEPYVQDNMLYLPWEVFYEDVGLNYTFDAVDEVITFYYANKSVSFNTKLHMAITQDGETTYVSVYKSGATYMIPADVLCRRLGIRFSRRDDVPMIRFITASNAVSDAEFIKKATAPVESPGDSPVQPSNPGTVAGPAAKYSLTLTFENAPGPGTEKILDVLDSFGQKALFFVTRERAAENPGLIFRMIASGHTIGLSGDAYETGGEFDLEKTIAKLDQFSRWFGRRFKTTPYLYRPPAGHYAAVGPDEKSSLSQAGYVVWGYQISLYGEGKNLSSRTVYANAVNRLSAVTRDSAILFDTTDATAGMLGDFVRYANRNNFTVRSVMLSTPAK